MARFGTLIKNIIYKNCHKRWTATKYYSAINNGTPRIFAIGAHDARLTKFGSTLRLNLTFNSLLDITVRTARNTYYL